MPMRQQDCGGGLHMSERPKYAPERGATQGEPFGAPVPVAGALKLPPGTKASDVYVLALGRPGGSGGMSYSLICRGTREQCEKRRESVGKQRLPSGEVRESNVGMAQIMPATRWDELKAQGLVA